MTATFPSVPEQLSAEWLTDVLRGGGHLDLDRRVARFEVTPVGAGILCILVRLHLTYTAGPSGDGPATIVAKFAHPVGANRQIGINTRMYEREASFFNDIAGLVDVPKPTCYFADVVAETGETVVLLEDLGDYRPGDQVAGVTVDEVRDIIEAIARLHAAFWDRTDVALLHDTMRIDTSYVEPFLIGMDATWERGAREFAADIAPDIVPHHHRRHLPARGRPKRGAGRCGAAACVVDRERSQPDGVARPDGLTVDYAGGSTGPPSSRASSAGIDQVSWSIRTAAFS